MVHFQRVVLVLSLLSVSIGVQAADVLNEGKDGQRPKQCIKNLAHADGTNESAADTIHEMDDDKAWELLTKIELFMNANKRFSPEGYHISTPNKEGGCQPFTTRRLNCEICFKNILKEGVKSVTLSSGLRLTKHEEMDKKLVLHAAPKKDGEYQFHYQCGWKSDAYQANAKVERDMWGRNKLVEPDQPTKSPKLTPKLFLIEMLSKGESNQSAYTASIAAHLSCEDYTKYFGSDRGGKPSTGKKGKAVN